MTPTQEDHEAAARIISGWKRLGGVWAEHNLTPYMETRLLDLIAAALSEAVRVAVEGEREANCFLVCWWCGNDYGIWEGTPVRFGPDDWKHRSKADPTRVIDCSASRLRNRAPMSKFGLGQAWVSKVTGDDTTEPSVLGAGLSQKDGSDAQATPAPACLMENPCTHAAEVARRGGCIDCHRNEIGLCAKHRGTPPETGEK